MFISDFAIKRPNVTVVSMVALVVFGLFALWQLDTDEFPDVQPPFVLVGIVYPGASPQGVEREVVDPVEEAISGISGVKHIQSTASDGYAQLGIEFVFEKDIQQATQDIRDAISAIRADLPAEMKEPILQRFDPTNLPIVSLTLASSELDPAQLTRLADPGITRVLRVIPGVAQVKVAGKVEAELSVELKPQALAASGVSVAQVVQALQSQNLAAPVGRLNTALTEQAIRLQGRLEGPEEFAQLVVGRGAEGQLIRLGQVATVSAGTEEPRTLALFNGREAVGIDIIKSKGYSTTEVSKQVRDEVENLRKTLPPGVEMDIVRDSGTRVANSVRNVKEALLEGALLTVLVVFLFLNSWRSTTITGVALPISVISSFIAVWIFGFTLNTMSLLGLSLAIGILIDDAIVVRENIVRHTHMGKDHFTAAREGTDEIGLAVVATTSSIVAVFIPVAFMDGVAGQWFKPFALTLACSVLVSLFVSFSLDPMLSAYWADPPVPEERKRWITRKLDRFNRAFERLAEWYKVVIAWALDHRWAMVGLATLSFVGALALPPLGLVGSGFMPVDDRSELNMVVETPPGSSLEYTRLKAEEAARLARLLPEVRYTYTTIGGASGAVDQASIYVRLVPMNQRQRSAEDLAVLMREEVKRLSGTTTSVFTNAMQGTNKQIQLQLRGNDLELLNRTAAHLADQVRRVPNAIDISLSTKGEKPELEVAINRDLAGALGLSVGQMAQALRPAFAGLEVGNWVDPTGETRKVRVRFSPEYRQRPGDLAQLPLTITPAFGGQPAVMPLGQVVELKETAGPAQITHLDLDKVVSVQANVSGRSLTEVMTDITTQMQATPFPLGVRLTQGGEVRDQQEVFGRIGAALAIAVGLMYLILVLQFNSFLDPLAIMVSLPLSLIGVMLALMITGSTINIMSLIGVILLMGIVVKNAILLIDFAKWARERQGISLREALIQAGAIRLRPILMTTFALIAGMIPVALGSGEGAMFRAPLGRAVIGGTITSTVLTLLVIPTVYEILDTWREKALRLFGRKGKSGTGGH
ncbi:MAG: efflux RND transporter permease subunit [Candidatus Latescibacteria bacterium]|nr:efflux RND transporter permease subunit [Candidatus Latescibacterota bacterium]